PASRHAGPSETPWLSSFDSGDASDLDEVSLALSADTVRDANAARLDYAAADMRLFTDVGSDNRDAQIATTLPFTRETAWNVALQIEMSRNATLGLNKRGSKAGYSLASLSNSEILGFLAVTAMTPPGLLLLRRRRRYN
ncbi:MAG: hypothetical protein ABUS51_05080, partial [Acidobacteriota bacterium]